MDSARSCSGERCIAEVALKLFGWELHAGVPQLHVLLQVRLRGKLSRAKRACAFESDEVACRPSVAVCDRTRGGIVVVNISWWWVHGVSAVGWLHRVVASSVAAESALVWLVSDGVVESSKEFRFASAKAGKLYALLSRELLTRDEASTM